MELGEKLKNARLAAGMTQKQLCGDRITRNMLSLIENGAATPSMETLCYLAKRLARPLGDFLEEARSPNQEIILRGRTLPPEEALECLRAYRPGDPLLDPEYYLLTALHRIALARVALADGRKSYCRELLNQARQAGENTLYFTPEWQRACLLLEAELSPEQAESLAEKLPDQRELLLRARSQLQKKRGENARGLLLTVRGKEADFIRAESYFAEKDYKNAAKYYEMLDPEQEVCRKLETCYRELGDFERAYHYACLQR